MSSLLLFIFSVSLFAKKESYFYSCESTIPVYQKKQGSVLQVNRDSDRFKLPKSAQSYFLGFGKQDFFIEFNLVKNYYILKNPKKLETFFIVDQKFDRHKGFFLIELESKKTKLIYFFRCNFNADEDRTE